MIDYPSASLIGICENIDFSLFTMPREGGLFSSSTSALLITTASPVAATISFAPGFSPSVSLTSGGSWTAPFGRTFATAMIGSSDEGLSTGAAVPF